MRRVNPAHGILGLALAATLVGCGGGDSDEVRSGDFGEGSTSSSTSAPPTESAPTEEVPTEGVLDAAAREGVVDKASVALEAILTRSPGVFDDQVEAAASLMTDKFAEEFRRTAAMTKRTIRQESITTTATVVKAGSIATAPDQIDVLVLAQQSVDRDGKVTKAPTAASLTMKLVDDDWLVDALVTPGNGAPMPTDLDASQEDVLEDAGEFLDALLSVDYRRIADTQAEVLEHSTGEFAQQFADVAKATAKALRAAKSVQIGTVDALGLAELAEPIEGAQVEVVASASAQLSTKASKGKPTRKSYLLVLTMERVDDDWLVSKVDFVA